MKCCHEWNLQLRVIHPHFNIIHYADKRIMNATVHNDPVLFTMTRYCSQWPGTVHHDLVLFTMTRYCSQWPCTVHNDPVLFTMTRFSDVLYVNEYKYKLPGIAIFQIRKFLKFLSWTQHKYTLNPSSTIAMHLLSMFYHSLACRLFDSKDEKFASLYSFYGIV